MIIAILLFFTYLIIENLLVKYYRSKIPHVIHVNGIRGKTGVSRLIDSELREQGYRVLTKTTGSNAMYINVDGIEYPIKRLGQPNIYEQIKFLRRAYKSKVDFLVIECMAVNPIYQYIAQHRILNADIGVITNVRYDHIFEMGFTLSDIAISLSNTVPKDGQLFTVKQTDTDNIFKEKCKELHSEFFVIDNCEDPLDTNISLANKVCAQFNNHEANNTYLKNTIVDYGANKLYQANDGYQYNFYNLFSVNDPQSASMLVDKIETKFKENIYIYNNRRDRPDRIILFFKYFFDDSTDYKVYVIGENYNLAKKIFSKKSNIEILDSIDIYEADTLYIGLGNIKGKGMNIIDEFEGRTKWIIIL